MTRRTPNDPTEKTGDFAPGHGSMRQSVGDQGMSATSKAALQNLNEELNKENRALSAKVTELERNHNNLSRLLSSLSHDIRTPLTALTSLTEVLKDLPEPDIPTISDEIQKSCGHLVSTLDSALDLAGVRSGQVQQLCESINVAELLEEVQVVSFPVSKNSKEGRRIQLKLEDRTIQVAAEKGALLRVVNNLVGNALKFCPDKPIEVRLFREADHARIEVADTGPGIGTKFREELFKPFTREKRSANGDPPGSGLGLSICQELISLMRGTIEVESCEGVGTTMIVRLPISRDQQATLPERDNQNRVFSPSANLIETLICDDHDATCRVLRRMLKGKAVTVVDNETELYQNLSGKDVLLLDINLHRKNHGIEVLRALRADPKHRQLRIVAFTAHCQPGQREQFLKEGFDDYLAKPFKKNDLLAKLFPVPSR